MDDSLKRQEGGDHYSQYPIQPVEFIVANEIPYREANVIKYVVRHQDKNGLEDLKKAKHYLEMLIDDYSEPDDGIVAELNAEQREYRFWLNINGKNEADMPFDSWLEWRNQCRVTDRPPRGFWA